jgi:hypothetical protein
MFTLAPTVQLVAPLRVAVEMLAFSGGTSQTFRVDHG